MRRLQHPLDYCYRRRPALRSAAVLTLALSLGLFVSACTSDDGGGGTASTVTGGVAGDPGQPTGSTAPLAQAGDPGPGGVGVVVATSDGSGTYVDISPDELAAMLEDKDFLLINVHIPYEGEIEQTDLFLPYDQAARQIGQLPGEKEAKIVVYCRSDRMSRISVEEWVKNGFTHLYNLDGGFVAWVAAGYELLQR